MQKILLLALGAIIVLFQVQLREGHGGIIDGNKIKLQINKQKQINGELRERNSLLEMKIAGLKGSTDSLEARSRNELNLIKPGEILVLLPGSDLNRVGAK
ncbi:MAG: septum formation initiator family protein [Burkholderiales bacterium]|nr:septum formation initiator family protein [Burkholderiales bacterium]